MSYCLLIKCVDGSLKLLSETPFDTRNEALDTLASCADNGGVDCATDQVWLIDLSSVAPVVLVGRPAMGGGAVFEPRPEVEVAPEPEAVIEVSPEPEPEVEVAEEPQLEEAIEPELPVEAALVAESEPPIDVPAPGLDLPEPGAVFEPDAAFAPAPVPEPVVLPVLAEDAVLPVEDAGEVVAEDGVEAEIEADASVEAENADEVSAAPAVGVAAVVPAVAVGESILDDLVIPEPEPEPTATEEDSFSDLREALERSAAQMASEVSEAQAAAADSVAAAPVEAAETIAIAEDVVAEPAEDEAEDAEASPEVFLEEYAESVDEPALEEPAVDEPIIELAEDEAIECGEVIDAEIEAAPTPEAIETAEPAEWPWAAKLPEIEPDAEPVDASASLSDVEAPADVAAEAMAGNVLGSAAVAAASATPVPVEPMSVTSGDETEIAFDGQGEDYTSLLQPISFAVPEVSAEPVLEPVEVVEPVEAPASEAIAAEPATTEPAESSPVDESNEVPAADPHDLMVPAGAGAPGYTPDSEGVADLTCHDCVWVDTCPNKDQRDPASCGSFQWK
ncbi:MAG TPA: hypothetical protein VFG89_03425 [Coriobacteriia bacterium]|nr:hypothetical protein [Coriobacteriia bacterium]